jgi:hypothetical protein
MPSLTTAELDLIRASDAALDRYEKAQTSRNAAELAKARKDLERIRGELEKFRDPNAKALEVMRKALAQPIDAATGALVKAKPTSQTGRSDRFDKLMRPAGAAALAK